MIEIRVHGMGDHADGSALGNPPVKVARYPDMPDTAVPPPLPGHDVRLINWSRTSRRALRLLWYLALPMTLVNVMGFMAPDGDRNRVAKWTLRIVTLLVGLVVTITVQVWLIAIIETIFRPIELAASNPALVGDAITVIVTAVLLIVILIRWIRGHAILLTGTMQSELKNERGWLVFASVASMAAVAAVGALIRFNPPTSWEGDWFLRYLSVPIPRDQETLSHLLETNPGASISQAICWAALPAMSQGELPDSFANRFDPLNAVVLGGLAIALVAWLILVLAQFTGDKTARAPLSIAALVAVVAVTGINAVGATLRLGFEWVMEYLDTMSSLGWIRSDRPMSLYERHIVAFQGQRIGECRTENGFLFNSTYYLDSLPLFMILGGISLGIALWVVNAADYSRVTHQRRATGKRRVLLFGHQVVQNLPSRIFPAMLIALPIWAILSLTFLYAVDMHTGDASLFWSDVVRVIAQATAVLAVLFVVLGGQLGGIRRVLSIVADIAGFWDTAYHPLAGDTYRRKVIEGLDEEVKLHAKEPTIVLVGHSQGSVISAWYAAHRDHDNLSLVTCGSPLKSLYETFFPRYFGSEFRRLVHDKVVTWDNVWRETDPIATPLLDELEPARDHLVEDPVDGRHDGIIHGHSDYWIDPRQMSVVASAGKPAGTAAKRKSKSAN
jgi:pimeloyl-ACP methyl ester carboxylesterase